MENIVPFGTMMSPITPVSFAVRTVRGTGGMTRRLSILWLSVSFHEGGAVKWTDTTQSSHFRSLIVL